jgi:hypothetical protein
MCYLNVVIFCNILLCSTCVNQRSSETSVHIQTTYVLCDLKKYTQKLCNWLQASQYFISAHDFQILYLICLKFEDDLRRCVLINQETSQIGIFLQTIFSLQLVKKCLWSLRLITAFICPYLETHESNPYNFILFL